MALLAKRYWAAGLLLVASAALNQGVAQVISNGQSIQTEVEVGGWAAPGRAMPFWLRANQFGIVPNETPAATARLGVWKAYAPADTLARRPRRFGWSFGLNPVVNAGARTQVLLPEAYLTVKFGGVELLAGRRRQLTGLGDSTLSSGFIAGSGNALPISRVQLATRGYLPIGFLGNFLAINAGYVHGWFNGPYIQESYLHQKHLYVRFGKPASAVKVHLGINHQVQWGGYADYLAAEPGLAVNGRLPASPKYYPYVVLARNPGQWATADYTSFDGAYRIGNHVGSIDGGVEVRTRPGRWLLYHQHVYEDLSGLLFLNVPDGLTGLSWTRTTPVASGLRHVVVEYLSTLHQSGSTFDVPGSSYQGADNYFNHGQYREGWSHLGRSIGTPFLAPGGELLPSARSNVFFPNNRVQAWYAGAAGTWAGVTCTARLAYSLNYGTFSAPYSTPPGQFSGLLSAQLPLPSLPGTLLSASLAVDQGGLLPRTAGGYVSLLKRW